MFVTSRFAVTSDSSDRVTTSIQLVGCLVRFFTCVDAGPDGRTTKLEVGGTTKIDVGGSSGTTKIDVREGVDVRTSSSHDTKEMFVLHNGVQQVSSVKIHQFSKCFAKGGDKYSTISAAAARSVSSRLK